MKLSWLTSSDSLLYQYRPTIINIASEKFGLNIRTVTICVKNTVRKITEN